MEMDLSAFAKKEVAGRWSKNCCKQKAAKLTCSWIHCSSSSEENHN